MGANFNLGDLQDWEQLRLGEPVSFEVAEGSVRDVRFELLASDECAAYAVFGVGRVLVAAGIGKLRCRFSAVETFDLEVEAVEGCSPEVYLRTGRDLGLRPEPSAASFTTIEPRAGGPSDDLRRMMYFVQLNARRRERQLQEQVERLERRFDAQRTEAAPEPQVAAPVGDPSDA